jgi:hypothetical protein
MKKGGEQEVRREIYGEWVSSGPRMWVHFDEADHVIVDPNYRRPEDLGLVDITKQFCREFYLEQDVDRHLGQDFNLDPMCSVEIQFAYHPRDPKKTPIAIVPDEVVSKVSTIYEHMDRLDQRGYARAGISCDATGAQFNSYRLSHGIKDKNSTQALEMRRRGFLCQPCSISDSGNPANPSQLEKLSPLHRLQMERIELDDGTLFPRYLIHARATSTVVTMKTQERDSRGNPAKEPGDAQDRISGRSDALCYGLYPFRGLLFPDVGAGVQWN